MSAHVHRDQQLYGVECSKIRVRHRDVIAFTFNSSLTFFSLQALTVSLLVSRLSPSVALWVPLFETRREQTILNIEHFTVRRKAAAVNYRFLAAPMSNLQRRGNLDNDIPVSAVRVLQQEQKPFCVSLSITRVAPV